MPPVVIAAGVAAVGSIAAAKISSNASKKAAQVQTDAASSAADRMAKATADSQAYTRQVMSPYMTLGQLGMGLLTAPGGPRRAPMGPAPVGVRPPGIDVPMGAQVAPQPPQPQVMPLGSFGISRG